MSDAVPNTPVLAIQRNLKILGTKDTFFALSTIEMPQEEAVSGFHGRCFFPKILVKSSLTVLRKLNEKVTYQKAASLSGMIKVET